MIELLKTDVVICAYARPAAGPGWANTPIWVVVKDKDGKLQERCLQPDEQTEIMRTVYGTAASLNGVLFNECRKLQLPKKKGLL